MGIETKKIATLTGHRDPIYALDKGITEQLIFSGSGDKVIAQWNLKTFKSEKFASFPNVIYSICHISEKKLLLVGTSDGNVHVLNLENKEKIKILKNHTAQVFNIRYSLETNCIYTAGGDGNFAICSLDTFDLIKIRKLCVEKVRNIDFNYTTSEIAVASADCTIRIFDIKTLQEKKILLAISFPQILCTSTLTENSF